MRASAPVDESVTYAVAWSIPPKQMFVTIRSGNGHELDRRVGTKQRDAAVEEGAHAESAVGLDREGVVEWRAGRRAPQVAAATGHPVDVDDAGPEHLPPPHATRRGVGHVQTIAVG